MDENYTKMKARNNIKYTIKIFKNALAVTEVLNLDETY